MSTAEVFHGCSPSRSVPVGTFRRRSCPRPRASAAVYALQSAHDPHVASDAAARGVSTGSTREGERSTTRWSSDRWTTAPGCCRGRSSAPPLVLVAPSGATVGMHDVRGSARTRPKDLGGRTRQSYPRDPASRGHGIRVTVHAFAGVEVAVLRIGRRRAVRAARFRRRNRPARPRPDNDPPGQPRPGPEEPTLLAVVYLSRRTQPERPTRKPRHVPDGDLERFTRRGLRRTVRAVNVSARSVPSAGRVRLPTTEQRSLARARTEPASSGRPQGHRDVDAERDGELHVDRWARPGRVEPVRVVLEDPHVPGDRRSPTIAVALTPEAVERVDLRSAPVAVVTAEHPVDAHPITGRPLPWFSSLLGHQLPAEIGSPPSRTCRTAVVGRQLCFDDLVPLLALHRTGLHEVGRPEKRDKAWRIRDRAATRSRLPGRC